MTSNTANKIRIRMEAYDHQALDASAREIVDHAKTHQRQGVGPRTPAHSDRALHCPA